MNNIELYKEWDRYLDNKCPVILDNDGWWFEEHIGVDHTHWVSGGSGPYGKDLLEYLCSKLGIEVKPV